MSDTIKRTEGIRDSFSRAETKDRLHGVRMNETTEKELDLIASCLSTTRSQAIRDSIHAAYLRITDDGIMEVVS